MNRNNSAARQYDVYHNAYEEQRIYPEKVSQPALKNKKHRKSSINTRRRHIRRTLGITYTRGVCYLVIYGILMVFLCSKSSMLSYDIINLKSDIASLETDNKRLAFQIQEKSSLERIAEIATTQLGMVKPDITKAYITDNIQPAQIPVTEENVEADQETAFQKLYASLKSLGDKAIKSGINFLASY